MEEPNGSYVVAFAVRRSSLARANRFRSGRMSGGSRRRTGWSAGPKENDSPPSAAVSTTALWQTGSLALADGLTVARIRGNFAAWLVVAATAGDGFLGAIGILNVTNEAFTAGVASVPSPMDDEDYDGWMFHRYFNLFSPSTSPIGNGGSYVTFPIDTKAMRKTTEGDVLVGVIQVIEAGNATIEWSARTRVLDFLP